MQYGKSVSQRLRKKIFDKYLNFPIFPVMDLKIINQTWSL